MPRVDQPSIEAAEDTSAKEHPDIRTEKLEDDSKDDFSNLNPDPSAYLSNEHMDPYMA